MAGGGALKPEGSCGSTYYGSAHGGSTYYGSAHGGSTYYGSNLLWRTEPETTSIRSEHDAAAPPTMDAPLGLGPGLGLGLGLGVGV
eukprot:scaffold55973_cov51-Phaeocystis_antarctica.AAC.2